MRYAAFLRAVNVAGNQLSMTALKALLESLGLEHPKSILQTGNVIFEADAQNAADLETLLQRETEERLNVCTEYFIRDAKAVAKIIADNPLVKEARTDPARLVVFLLKQRPARKSVEKLQAQIKGPEMVTWGDRHVYISYPEGQGRSKLTNAVIEKLLASRGTARNWNTVLKMYAAIGATRY